VPLANGLGEGLEEQGGASNRCHQFEYSRRARHERRDAFLPRAFEGDRRELTHHPLDLELRYLFEKRLHVVEVAEDRAGRNACALGHFFGPGAQQAVFEAIEHGLGYGVSSALGARVSSVGCRHPKILYCHSR
jgi:hypothetical protein